MFIHEIVENVTARLKAHITGLEIARFPDKPGDYRLRHPRGALLVHYAGSEADKARRPRIAIRAVARFEGAHGLPSADIPTRFSRWCEVEPPYPCMERLAPERVLQACLERLA